MMAQSTWERRESRPSALTPIARHPWVSSLLVVAMGLAGVIIAWASPVSHRAEARLAVGPASNSAYVISGYPLAARDLAANYSRFVRNNAGDATWTPAGVTDVNASPIPDSAVIRIETKATDPDRAVAGAQQVATTLVAVVSRQQARNDPALALAQFEKLAPQVAAAQAAVDNARTSKARERARVLLATTQLRRDAHGERYRRLFSDPQVVSRLQVIQPARVVGDSRSASVARWAMLGLGIGFMLALVVTTLWERRRPALGTAAVAANPGTVHHPERELTQVR